MQKKLEQWLQAIGNDNFAWHFRETTKGMNTKINGFEWLEWRDNRTHELPGAVCHLANLN